MLNIKRKLKEFDQRPWKRRELYSQIALPWFMAGAAFIGGIELIENAIAHESSLWLLLIAGMLLYLVFALSYMGINIIKPYMDGIYKQHLKEHEGQKVKEWR